MKKLNIQTCPGLKGRLHMPLIKVSKAGLVFNEAAAKLLAFIPNEPNKISFDIEGNVLYMYWDNTEGFPVVYGTTKRFTIFNSYLSQEIMDHIKIKNPRLAIGAFQEGKYRLTHINV